MPDKPCQPIFAPGTLVTAELLNDAFGKLWDAVDDLRREVKALKAQHGGGQDVDPSNFGFVGRDPDPEQDRGPRNHPGGGPHGRAHDHRLG
jgi:hypothetical protein